MPLVRTTRWTALAVPVLLLPALVPLLAAPALAAPGDPLGTATVLSATFSDAVPVPTNPASARYCGGTGQTACADVPFPPPADSPSSQVRWGRPLDGSPQWDDQSGLGLAPAPAVAVVEGEDVVLGSLVHFNQPVNGGVEAVSLQVVTRLTTPEGGTVDVPVDVDFSVDETPNSGPPSACTYPSDLPCADAVTVVGGTGTGSGVSGVTRYTVEVLGFADASGAPVSTFVSQEGQENNAARLLAAVTTASALEADAGPDQEVDERSAVALAGSVAPDAAQPSWTQLSGPDVVLSDASAAAPTFTAPEVLEPTSLVFRLQALGAPWAPAEDEVTVLVRPVDDPPTADAGADRTVEQTSPAGADVTLAGTGSDPDGDALTYTWTGPFGTATGPSPTVLLPPGTSVVTLAVSDGTSTVTDAVQITVLDRTPPTISASRDPLPNAAGWSRSPVTVTFTCADTGSGVVTCSPPVELGEGADQSVTGEAVDGAGHRATATVADVDVDLTDPVIAFTGAQPTYDVDEVLDITCTATDALSGLADSDCPGASGPAWQYAGPTTLTATATDVAGNASTGSVSFSVVVTTEGLCRLTTQLSDSAGVAHSLCAKLRAAQASEDRGQAGTAEQQRQAYRNELAAQSGKAFTEQEAARLAALSEQL